MPEPERTNRAILKILRLNRRRISAKSRNNCVGATSTPKSLNFCERLLKLHRLPSGDTSRRGRVPALAKQARAAPLPFVTQSTALRRRLSAGLVKRERGPRRHVTPGACKTATCNNFPEAGHPGQLCHGPKQGLAGQASSFRCLIRQFVLSRQLINLIPSVADTLSDSESFIHSSIRSAS